MAGGRAPRWLVLLSALCKCRDSLKAFSHSVNLVHGTHGKKMDAPAYAWQEDPGGGAGLADCILQGLVQRVGGRDHVLLTQQGVSPKEGRRGAKQDRVAAQYATRRSILSHASSPKFSEA